MELTWQAWLTLGVVAAMFVALLRDWAPPEGVIMGALGALLLSGVLGPDQAFAGLSNTAVLSVGTLFILSAAVQKTGALQFAIRLIFPPRAAVAGARTRLLLITATVSSFFNNTPLVAMLMPPVQAWCDKNKVSPSKLMLPLSYATILGGMVTLMGTSTNLVVAGLYTAAGHAPMGLFDITIIGLPAATAALVYLIVIGHRLLPHRAVNKSKDAEDLQNLLFEVRVRPGSRLAGSTIEDSGLRALGDAYLVHLRRGNEVVPSAPDRRLVEGDTLSFLGNAATLERLRLMPEFVAHDAHANHARPLPMYEAVVAPGSGLVGKTLKEAGFRAHYEGVVLGIHRRDEEITGPLGQIKIRPGDLLIIEARQGFEQRWAGQTDEFFLVAPYRGTPAPFRPERAAIAITTLLGVVLLAALNVVPIVTAAFGGALIVIATGCLTMQEARQAVNVKLLATIAGALGVGKAIEVTGLADALAALVVGNLAPLGPIGSIAGVYLATMLITELITNNAAAAIMLPIGLATAEQLGMPPASLAILVAVAASASFMTPIGYQTNLMVMSAGGYRFGDYFKAGWPVSLIVGVVSITMAWLVWL